jgi:hypothetical protein
MALDYSQIELRAVAELISEWLGTDSILRQHFAAGLMRMSQPQWR